MREVLKSVSPARFSLYLVIVAGSLLCGTNICRAADDEAIDRQHRQMVANTLKGIQRIQVVVEDVRPDAQSFGLNKQQIQNDIELKLRTAGIQVSAEPPAPFFYARVNTFYLPNEDAFAIGIECQVHETVILARDPSIQRIATTWQRSHSGAVESANLVSAVREQVKDITEMFINDYLSVNPR